MAFSIYQSFLCLILCIALVLPSGLAQGSRPKFQCVAQCTNPPSYCSQLCKTKGYGLGGECMFKGPLNQCCCVPNPPKLW
ncbi:LCR-like protein [Medicago truncatula]|uniref:LCR-like protein n=1 Tax=Medicago truncatula TaxID=3880 RepID=A0A072U0F0_MEDTR|nr:LCR-like protein [Medicago truncatula]